MRSFNFFTALIVGVMTLMCIPSMAWDDFDTTTHGNNDTSLLGKTVQIWYETDDDCDDNVIGAVVAINEGLLYFDNPIMSSYNSGPWTHTGGPVWVPIARINSMKLATMPTDAESSEIPAEPGFEAIFALLGMVGVAALVLRK